MNIYSPWPEPGERVKFLRRFSYHVRCAYITSGKPKWQWWALRKTFKAKLGTWWFLSVRLGKYGFYVGYKPVTLVDPKFIVPESFPRETPACEFSVRISNSRDGNQGA